MRPHVEELRKLGVEPYVIGSGNQEQAREFAELVGAGDVPILSDSKLVSYRAAGMKRSVGATLSLKGLMSYVRAFKRFKQGKTAGDPWQLGGAFIVKPSGEITYAYRSAFGGDHPAPQLLVEEARKAAQ